MASSRLRDSQPLCLLLGVFPNECEHDPEANCGYAEPQTSTDEIGSKVPEVFTSYREDFIGRKYIEKASQV